MYWIPFIEKVKATKGTTYSIHFNGVLRNEYTVVPIIHVLITKSFQKGSGSRREVCTCPEHKIVCACTIFLNLGGKINEDLFNL